jgi:formate-dependent phosphoribosylglycinamide formyltransferase (GAR transformylase)
LQEAYKSGDKTAVDAAKLAVEGIQQDRQANRAAAKTVHADVAELRGDRKQLAADVKANNVDAIQPDIDAVNQAHDQILVDTQA